MNPDKLSLIEVAKTLTPINSFADIGGVWNVGAGYTFSLLKAGVVDRAYLVDYHIPNEVVDKAGLYPELDLLEGDFSSHYTKIEPVDAVLLFDFLLHQVNPNWDDILDLLTPRTKTFIIYNPQWTGSVDSERLTGMSLAEYEKNTPEIAHRILSPSDTNLWQYGITDADLIRTLHILGFDLRYAKDYGKAFDLPNFRNKGFIFKKRQTTSHPEKSEAKGE